MMLPTPQTCVAVTTQPIKELLSTHTFMTREKKPSKGGDRAWNKRLFFSFLFLKQAILRQKKRFIENQELWNVWLFEEVGPRGGKSFKRGGYLHSKWMNEWMNGVLLRTTEEETEVQRGGGACPRPHSWWKKASVAGVKHEADLETWQAPDPQPGRLGCLTWGRDVTSDRQGAG